MKKGPLYVLVGAVLVIVSLYFLMDTKPPKQGGGGDDGGHLEQKGAPVNFDSIVIAGKKGMGQHGLGELQKIEQQLKQSTDSLAMVPHLEAYADVWKEHKGFIVAAYYYSLAAKLEKSEKKLTFAAQLFLDLARNEHSQSIMAWEVEHAVSNYELLLEMNKDNDTARLGLAECYFGMGEAMKGVTILKEITAKDPEHKSANLFLGQQGLVSGQFDKSKERFETVLKNDPENLEAMLGLAESFKGLGDKQKAIAILENCKKIIKNPAFAKDIDDYINTFK